MIPLRFAYLVGDLVFLAIWLLLYYHRKDLRREMWAMSIFIALAGVIAEYYMWTKDWWRPTTITGTIVGFEDFLLGFTNGGIAAVLYEEILRRRFYKRQAHSNHIQCLLFAIGIGFVMSVSFWVFGHTSFIATAIGLAVGGGILVVLRKDLLVSSLTNGALMALVVFPAYYVPIWVSPGVIEKTYLFDHLTRITITGVPIEDIIFYFLVGFLVAPLYEYWQCVGLRKIPAIKNHRNFKKRRRF